MASSSHSNPPDDANEDFNLILVKGRGAKRKFNNKNARVVSTRSNKGGWVSVQIEGEEHPISWRSKAWQLSETDTTRTSTRVSLASLPDECLVHVFSFLGAGEHRVSNDPEDLSRDFSEEHLSGNLSPEYVDIKLRLCDAMKLHKIIALLSKRFLHLCRKHIPSILGHLDADLIVNPWHRYTPWLTKNALRLRSLELKSQVFEDCVIPIYILRKCDVSRLTTLSACFKSVGPTHNHTLMTMVELVGVADVESCQVNGVYYAETLAPRLPASLDTLKAKATMLGLPDLYENPVRSRRELHDLIADLCPSLINLKLVHDLGHLVDPEIGRGALFRKRTIRQLHLVLCVALDLLFENFRLHHHAPYSTISVTEIVNSIPNLKVLKMSNGDSDRIYDQCFRLSSASLQKIDLLGTGKNNWITKCECPKLERLDCCSSAYGNGVRPRKDGGRISLLDNDRGQFLAGRTRFDGTLEWSNRTVVFEGLNVPDSCVVYLV